MNEFEETIQRIKTSSPLELPQILLATELHDQKTAVELYKETSKNFENEGILKNTSNIE